MMSGRTSGILGSHSYDRCLTEYAEEGAQCKRYLQRLLDCL